MLRENRDVHAATCERKFVIDAISARHVLEWARRRLRADPHGTGAFGDQYWNTTLYFDTPQYDVLSRRRSFDKAKYRIRRYGADDVVFLERKLCTSSVRIKRRSAVHRSLLPVFDIPCPTAPWAGLWFHRRLLARDLDLACSVKYRRIARVLETGDGAARLTLDESMTVRTPQRWNFSHSGAVGFLTGRPILELKYAGRLPPAFRELVDEFGLVPEAASKYRLAMTALGHVTAAPDERTAATSNESTRPGADLDQV